MGVIFNAETYGALPCPFCGYGGWFAFENGAVCCDQCQAEGPFNGRHFDGLGEGEMEFARKQAVKLWNARGEDEYDLATD